MLMTRPPRSKQLELCTRPQRYLIRVIARRLISYTPPSTKMQRSLMAISRYQLDTSITFTLSETRVKSDNSIVLDERDAGIKHPPISSLKLRCEDTSQKFAEPFSKTKIDSMSDTSRTLANETPLDAFRFPPSPEWLPQNIGLPARCIYLHAHYHVLNTISHGTGHG